MSDPDADGILLAYVLDVFERVLGSLRFSLVIRTSTNLYLISSLIALTLNVAVAAVILVNRRLHKVVCFYILSLCVSHGVYGLKTFLLSIVVLFTDESTVSRETIVALQTANEFFVMLCFLATMYTMCALSFHQYWSIVHVYRRQPGRRLTTASLLLMWTLSAVVSGVILAIKRGLDLNRTTEQPGDKGLAIALVLIVITFVIPVTVVTVLIGISICQLRKSNEIDLLYESAMPLKKRALHMLITTFLLFTVNWSVFWLVQLYYSLVRKAGTNYVFIFAAGSSLAISYSWINVSIYIYFFTDLRRAFFRVFSRHCGKLPAAIRRRRSTLSKSATA